MATMTVAVLGAGGTMGSAMARNLLRAGHRVQAWNRTPERALPVEEAGAKLAGTPADAAAGADLLVTMLNDADSVVEVVTGEEGALAGLPAGAVWLQTSTIGLGGTERCVVLADERGTTFVDAPVLGTKQPAEAGQLVVLASGPDDASVRERANTVFDVIGARTLWLGEAGAGSRLKLVTNSWIVAVVEGAAEAIALAQTLGLDPQGLFAAVEGGSLDLPYLRLKGNAMIARDFTPSFKLSLAAKDARLVVEAAERFELRLPLVETVARQMTVASEEHGDGDIGSVYLAVAPPAERGA
ncbi:MAG TPA: NAD(P)-dependent oxidoreductase [Conexibacter sp.]|jgi:3-hydroxyisobutyrate dehydrogenase